MSTQYPYTIHLSIEVKANSKSEAHELGTSAAEHLMDTFNDDESLNPLVGISITGPRD